MSFLSRLTALTLIILLFPILLIVEIGYLFTKDSPSDDTREF